MDEELKERLVSSRRVFEGRLLVLQVDEVELAGGARAEREVVRHPGAVAVVALLAGDPSAGSLRLRSGLAGSPRAESRGDQVVMIRQYRHAAGEMLWELPAGVLMPACARRELIEEVGYEPGDVTPLLSLFPSPGFSSEVIHLFVARKLRSVKRLAQPDERIAVELVPFDQAVAMALRGEVRNAAAVCGLLALAERRKREGEQEVAPVG
jgi:8-oxo-dGTP pyrophosphatase MutT (NUDIX family)